MTVTELLLTAVGIEQIETAGTGFGSGRNDLHFDDVLPRSAVQRDLRGSPLPELGIESNSVIPNSLKSGQRLSIIKKRDRELHGRTEKCCCKKQHEK